MKINFGGWPEEIHSDFEQVKRIESSKKLKKDVVSLDLDSGQVIIQGSGSDPYKATLHECTCRTSQSGRRLASICIIWREKWES